MNTLLHKIIYSFLGILTLGVGASIPIANEDLTFLYAYQYPVNSYREYISEQTATSTAIKNPQPKYKDDNKDGLISVSVFEDKFGNKHYVQIEESLYSDMGKKGGYYKNPKAKKTSNLIELLTDNVEAAVAVQDTSVGLATASSVTFAHIVASGEFLFVGTTNYIDTVSSVTYNGTALTSQVNGVNGNYKCNISTLTTPDIGTYNVVTTLSGSDTFISGALSLSGVNLSSPIDGTTTGTGTGENNTTSITTNNANSFLLDCGSSAIPSTNESASAPTTSYFRSSRVDHYGIIGARTTTTAGSYDMTWTWTGSVAWTHAIIAINEATAPAVSTPTEDYIILFE